MATELAYEYFKVKRKLRGWRAAGAVLKTVYLSLGSNIGDREANLRAAIERLAAAM